MMIARAYVPLLLLVAAPAQQGKDETFVSSPPVIADAKDPVAARLAGDWQYDEQLANRLGHKQVGFGALHVEVTNQLPATMAASVAAKLATRRVRAAGTVTEPANKRSYAFALAADVRGDLAFLILFVRDDKVVECIEGPFALVAGAKAANDMLFLPGKNVRVAVFTRGTAQGSEKVAAVEAGAPDLATALATIERLLTEKKYLELVQSFVSPKDRDSITNSGKTLEDVAAEFVKGGAAAELEKLVPKVKGTEPTTSTDGNTATWASPDGGRDLKFVRVDGRWYLR